MDPVGKDGNPNLFVALFLVTYLRPPKTQRVAVEPLRSVSQAPSILPCRIDVNLVTGLSGIQMQQAKINGFGNHRSKSSVICTEFSREARKYDHGVGYPNDGYSDGRRNGFAR